MIEYKKTILDGECLDLLKTYEPHIPLKHFVLGHENDLMTFVKVFYDQKCYGLIVCRAERDIDNELVLVILHVVAHKDIDVHFHSILGSSIFEWAASLKFDLIRQHADRAGLARMLQKYYGNPTEAIYTKRLKCPQVQSQVPVRKLQITIKGLETKAEL